MVTLGDVVIIDKRIIQVVSVANLIKEVEQGLVTRSTKARLEEL